jgi:hypothetical protein
MFINQVLSDATTLHMMKDYMKKSLQKIIVGLMFVFAIFKSDGVCQEFNTSPLITTPGNNLEYDVVTPEWGSLYNCVTLICWVNKLDTVYTVYLKQISPTVGDSMVVDSDTLFKSRPQITPRTIGWQSMHDNLWQVSIRNYSSNQFTPPVRILDSLAEDPHFTLSNSRIVWIQNNNLFVKTYYPNQGTPILVDNGICYSPHIQKQDDTTYNEILYEKVVNGQQRIAMARFNYYATPQWSYALLAGDSARNPNFGISGGVSFEIVINQISRIQYSMYGSFDWFSTTTNQTCNYKNPGVFSYPIPIGKGSSTTIPTPFFIVFDSDSLPGNNEIFMKPFYFGNYDDTIINISRSNGNDVEPRLSYMFSNDTVFVAALWKHTQLGKTDIWMASTPFNPINNGVEEEKNHASSFRILQNYPNPFNPKTKITFFIGTYGYTSLRVYDVLGREVATIFSGELPAGSYTKQWNAAGMPSGVYFYRLQSRPASGGQAGYYTETKKLVLLK